MAASTDRTSELGRTIRSLREAKGWSRDTLGRKADVGEATIARVELYGAVPSLSVLMKLATTLEVPAGDLITTGAVS